MKKIYVVVAAILLLTQMTGCSTLQKKFTRKAKEPLHKQSVIYLDKGPYQKKYSNEYYYKSHFTLWKTWQDELIGDLGGNQKKLAGSATSALSELKAMNKYLVPEKQGELKIYLDALQKIADRIESRTMSRSDDGRTRSDLEMIQRVVSANFYFDKVKEKIISESIDLAAK